MTRAAGDALSRENEEAPAAETGARARRGPPPLVLFVALPAIALFIALLTYGLIANAPDTGIDDSLAGGEPAKPPAFELPVLERGDLGPRLQSSLGPALADKRLALNELRGRRVVLNFWASWCVPCQEEAPLLERTWLRARRHGVVFVGLNMQDLTGDAREFIRRYGNTYLNVRDPTDGVARKWGLTGIPETFFITARGRVVAHVIGVVSEKQMRAGIAATATGRPVSSSQGGDRRRTR
jgi:cytochrome c biogenesis protein CcmG/thiol:disulfide interchange protein DsbE